MTDKDTQEEVRLPDPEVVALRHIVEEFLSLDEKTRTRMAGYLYDRFGGA